jgi:diguanylate cyclase (GGDEF)-like protein
MSPPFLKRRTGWLPAAVVLAVVLITGSRLIMLSVQQHAETAREASRAEATRAALSIESQLQVLTGLAHRQRMGIRAWGRQRSEGERARPHARRQSMDHRRPSAGHGERPECRHAATRLGSGVRRLGSVAVRNSARPDRGCRLRLRSDAGESRSASTRSFASSSSAPLDVPVVRSIHLPAGFVPAIAGSDLQIAIRPRAGWYPASELGTEIGVLAILAWVLVFGTHDLTHSLRRLQERLAESRQRQHALSARLSAEIEQRQDLQKSFDHARYHDGFTGLPNRRYFMNQLDRALREVRTRRRPRIAVILIDITRFRIINDTLGHTAGDELMMQAARRFANSTAGAECILARWGGDQFAVLLLDVPSPESAATLAGILQDALQMPFDLRKHRLSVTASIGLTNVESSQRAEDVVREADIALSAAKKDETSRTLAYAPAMGGQAASLVSLEADLHVALANNEFRLVFQPIVDLRTYYMVGAEVLLRWRHPVEGMLAPERFLAIAEEAGLMVAITRRIILRACKHAAAWRKRLPGDQVLHQHQSLGGGAARSGTERVRGGRITGDASAGLDSEIRGDRGGADQQRRCGARSPRASA